MENLARAERGEGLRNEIEAAGRQAAAQDEHIVRVEVELQAGAQLLRIVQKMLVGDAQESVRAQRGHDPVDIRPPDLMRQDRLAGLDELISGGEHRESRL